MITVTHTHTPPGGITHQSLYNITTLGFHQEVLNANAGDVSPNTWLKPGQGPTNDQFKNVKIQGEKQANAVRSQLKSAGTPVGKGLDSRISYFNFSGMNVDAKYTGGGHNERTCQGFLSTSFGSGSTEDGGGGWDAYREGSGCPSIQGTLVFTPSVAQARCQQPKGILFSTKNGTIIQEKYPVQIMRFGVPGDGSLEGVG